MYSCPACGAADISNQSTCACGADISLLRRLDSVADAWFNRAVEACAKGEPGRALEWLSACCVVRPTDAAARRAQAKAWAQLGRWDDARYVLDAAAAIDPHAPELQEIRQALQDAVNVKRGTREQKNVAATDSGSKKARQDSTKKKRPHLKGRRR